MWNSRLHVQRAGASRSKNIGKKMNYSKFQAVVKPSIICVALMLSLVGAAQGNTLKRTSSQTYYANGQLFTTYVEPDDVRVKLATTYAYDIRGNLNNTTITSGATGNAAITTRGVSTNYGTYAQFPLTSTDSLNQKTSRSYISDFGVIQSYTAPSSDIYRYTYDSFGRKSAAYPPAGVTYRGWVYSYCVGVNNGTATCPANAAYVIQRSVNSDAAINLEPWQKTYFDLAEREVRSETQGFDGTSVIRKDTEYDELGRVYRSSRPYYANQPQQWTYFEYDDLNRVTKTTGPDGAVVTTEYDGLTTKVTNPLRQTRTTIKNNVGLIAQVEDAVGSTLKYEYDAHGNLSKTTDPKGNVTQMTYDAYGHKTSMIDPDLGTWLYEYNAVGALVKQTSPKGQVTTYAYDVLGRLTSRTEPDLTSTWAYDDCRAGSLCHVKSDNGYVKDLTYNSLGDVTTEAINTSATERYIASRSFDANLRLDTMTYPTGLKIKFIYTSNGYVKELRNADTSALYWQANAMDAEGHLTQQTYGNNVVTQQVFDPATGRTKTIAAGAGNTVQNLSFTYDVNGNVLTRADANQSLSESFLYDTLNRLTSNTVNSSGAGVVTQTYGYDSIGNITSRSDTGTYTYGAVNLRPHAVDHIAMVDGGTRQYSYDAVGNLIQEVQRDASNNVIPAKGRTETWTSFNMPLTLSSQASTASFVYGPDHQRIKMTADGTTTTYINPGNAGGLLYEKDVKSNGTVEHRHFVTAGGGVVALIKQSGTGDKTVLYMHRDHLGSTTTVTNASGAVIERMAYEPFGKRRTPAGVMDPNNVIAGVNTDRGYTNHEHLDGLDLIHMNGRVYDPSTGRFLSADPGVPYPTDLQSYNRYSYTRNNPLVMVDPSGFDDEEVVDDHKKVNCACSSSGVEREQFGDVKDSAARLGADRLEKVTDEDGKLIEVPVVEVPGDRSAGDSWRVTPADRVVGNMLLIASNGVPVGRVLNVAGDAIKFLNSSRKTTTLFRAVSPEEFNALIKSKKFSFGPNGSEMKQFGFSLDEVVKFADFASDYAAVIKIEVKTSVLSNFSVTLGKIDPFIFKSGVVTVNGQAGINILNKAVKSIEHAF
ncbi:RHS repeat-associated core domain-containing protein [Duganella radicis]|uniref:Teneurin-like YD-shell domain-containing protein n=1 Tax=Duganella radicis TaxID=551988 RepID=A0A6L6PPK4_9BURK|nr:RHS repeat-associated core domain-containing protein [Duganella radicis]MTV40551.1 hypothetical protein [Duganella radicis]